MPTGSSSTSRSFGFVAVAALVLTTHLDAQEWPQWRGAERRAHWQETGIVQRFPEEALSVTWRVPIRSGYAGPAVAGGRVFVLDWEQDATSRTLDGTERLIVLDETTGTVAWSYEWQTSYRSLMGSYAIGPGRRRPSTKLACTS